MDISPLGVRQGANLGGLGRIIMNAHLAQIHPGVVLHTGLQAIRHPGRIIFRLKGRCCNVLRRCGFCLESGVSCVVMRAVFYQSIHRNIRIVMAAIIVNHGIILLITRYT
ncbi:MAG TPA: hypothetical protein VHY08_22990, partial [Bacillota bacterium]|nr:hypothetical protein [Bacillota bacterium]